MSDKILLTLFLCVIHIISGRNVFLKCQASDPQCLTKSVHGGIHQLIIGMPEIGLETSDPMHQDVLDINTDVFNAHLTDTDLTGFKECVAYDVRMAQDELQMQVKINCQQLDLIGKYDLNGVIASYPLKGEGSYKIHLGELDIQLDLNLDIYTDAAGQIRIKLDESNIAKEYKEPAKFQFDNLTGGKNDLADVANNFLNNNWREVLIVGDPIVQTSARKIIKNFNKYLSTVPLGEFLQF